jgi:hypothetical protein
MKEEQQARALIVELGMPSGVTPVHLTTSWRVGKKGLCFHFELFGRNVEMASEGNVAGLLVRLHGRHRSKHGSVFQVWQQTVTCEGSSVHGELR